MRIVFYSLSISVLVLAGCGQQASNTAADKDSAKTTAELPVTDPVQVMPSKDIDEWKDDSVFADGSVPTSWENAGIDRPKELKTFIHKLQEWIAGDKKEDIAAAIRYPLNKTVKTPDDFMKQYDQLITPKVKNAVASINFRQIFRNQKGVMIGNGELWISQDGKEYKIIAINK